MKIITVSGSYSGVGKTRVVTELLKSLKKWSALKVTVSHNGSCGRGKPCGVCDELSGSFSLIADDSIISREGKDTRRFKDAGAKEVLWLKATTKGLNDGLKEAISRFKETEGVIIEGTSVLRHIEPNLAIFVTGKDGNLKPSAKTALAGADIVLEI